MEIKCFGVSYSYLVLQFLQDTKDITPIILNATQMMYKLYLPIYYY